MPVPSVRVSVTDGMTEPVRATAAAAPVVEYLTIVRPPLLHWTNAVPLVSLFEQPPSRSPWARCR